MNHIEFYRIRFHLFLRIRMVTEIFGHGMSYRGSNEIQSSSILQLKKFRIIITGKHSNCQHFESFLIIATANYIQKSSFIQLEFRNQLFFVKYLFHECCNSLRRTQIKMKLETKKY